MIARAGALLLAMLATSAAGAAPVVQTALPQLLPFPGPAPAPTTPAPMPPPINPGYAAAPPNGLSPLLTQPGPVYELPAPASPSYPQLRLPGPIDQQKMQSYRNESFGRQRQLDRAGVSSGSERSREIEQQLNQPDSQ